MTEASSPPDRGKYIVLEGGEYVGKTKQAEVLARKIGGYVIREPGETELGELLRGILLNVDIVTDPITEVLLHAAQRVELAQTVIRPSLAVGRHIISDRNWLSSAAYQGAQGVELETIERINSYALGDLLKPDLILVLDADPRVVKLRSGAKQDYYESLAIDFHNEVRYNYLALAKRLGATVIDASAELEKVAADIELEVSTRLGNIS